MKFFKNRNFKKAKSDYKNQLSDLGASWRDAWHHLSFLCTQIFKDLVYLFIITISIKFSTEALPPKIISSIVNHVKGTSKFYIVTGRGYLLSLFFIILYAILVAFIIKWCVHKILTTTFNYNKYTAMKYTKSLKQKHDKKVTKKFEMDQYNKSQKDKEEFKNIRAQHKLHRMTKKSKHHKNQ